MSQFGANEDEEGQLAGRPAGPPFVGLQRRSIDWTDGQTPGSPGCSSPINGMEMSPSLFGVNLLLIASMPHHSVTERRRKKARYSCCLSLSLSLSLSAAPGWENEIFTTMSFRFFRRRDAATWETTRVEIDFCWPKRLTGFSHF